MTRILVWNIEDFDLDKISGGDLTLNNFYQETTANMATGRVDYIMANIRQVTAPNGGGAALPDIIVVIEVSAKPEYQAFGANWHAALPNIGRLAAGLGGQGAERLLRRIRADTGNAHWMMVPPLMTGPKDAVAVYYDSSNYCFAGPLRWPGGNGPAREGGDVGGDYPPPFNDALPDTPIPRGLPNARTSEKRAAASTIFHAMDGTAFAWNDRARRPYLVVLGEVDYSQNPPVLRRKISLFAIHGPADASRDAYVRSLATVREIAEAPADNEVKILASDFNNNLLAVDFAVNPNYQPLHDLGYRLGLVPPPIAIPPPPADPSGYRGYFATTVKGLQPDNNGQANRLAQFWYNRPGNVTSRRSYNYYPGFGYFGTDAPQVGNNDAVYSLDNFFAWFGGAAGGPINNCTGLNGVVPPPYGTAVNPAGNPPQGHYVFPWQMTSVAFQNPPDVLPERTNQQNAPRKTALRQWNNLGHIRSTSDHMALVADF